MKTTARLIKMLRSINEVVCGPHIKGLANEAAERLQFISGVSEEEIKDA